MFEQQRALSADRCAQQWTSLEPSGRLIEGSPQAPSPLPAATPQNPYFPRILLPAPLNLILFKDRAAVSGDAAAAALAAFEPLWLRTAFAQHWMFCNFDHALPAAEGEFIR